MRRTMLFFGLALLLASPASARDVPGVRFLDAGDGRVRLEVGGTAQQGPSTPDEVCLAWTWDEPGPETEVYPGEVAGTFVAAEKTWSLTADGTSLSPCPGVSPFPELGLGHGNELWFLRSPDDPAAGTAWANLLHTVEAAYRQSAPLGEPPLSVMTVGAYGRCEIRSIPVDLRTRLDRWLPVELPGTEPPALVRIRRFAWWVEPTPGEAGCGSGPTGTLRLFPLPAEDREEDTQRFLVSVEAPASRTVAPPDLDPEDRSPRVRALVPVEPPEVPPDVPPDTRDRSAVLAPTLAVVSAILALAALLRSRPRWTKPGLERLIESTVRRLESSPSPSGSGGLGVRAPESDALRRLLDDASRRLERRAAELRSDLDAHSWKLRSSLPRTPAASSLRPDGPRLEENERRRLVDGLEAMSELGRWIELLWPVLREASSSELDAVASGLPEPAAEEWRRARETLEDFSTRDAAAAREVLERLSSCNGCEPVDLAAARFLENSGLLDRDLALPERLKRHLEPFDHPGRLGRVTLALQYLLEAYPIEQLEPARRTLLRRAMSEAAGSVRLPEDFHGLIARIAAGVGLDYRAVAYYKSRLDQREYAFVRGQVSPISLTERVGFAAATDPAVVVRLERPFFFQSANQLYYAGHAHVARG